MRSIYSASLLLCSTALGLAASVPAKSQTVLPDPAITAYAQAYDANFSPDKVFDNNPATAYASKDKGINTFINFDFGAATVINGFDMKQRNDNARVLTSNLIFDDNADFASPLTTINLTHTNTAAALDQYTFANITARYVRWDVVTNNSQYALANGAAEMTFYGPATPADPVPGPASFLLAPAFAASANRLRRLRRRSRQWSASNTIIS
ncbi:MAG: discoidin domain-containing protein [Cyanobacteriota bacterium]|nr:discoidin domain-containing protein [Cyanobacteriota bacterium]